jgi:hypothetical protein
MWEFLLDLVFSVALFLKHAYALSWSIITENIYQLNKWSAKARMFTDLLFFVDYNDLRQSIALFMVSLLFASKYTIANPEGR